MQLLLGFRRKGDTERRCWRMTSVTWNLEAKYGLKTSVNYCGADPQRALKVNNKILKAPLCSQVDSATELKRGDVLSGS